MPSVHDRSGTCVFSDMERQHSSGWKLPFSNKNLVCTRFDVFIRVALAVIMSSLAAAIAEKVTAIITSAKLITCSFAACDSTQLHQRRRPATPTHHIHLY